MNFLNRFRISTKLAISFSTLAFLILLVGVTGYQGISKVADAGNGVLNEQLPISEFSLHLSHQVVSLRDLLAEYLGRSEGLEAIEDNYRKQVGKLRKEYEKGQSLQLTASGRQFVKEFAVLLDSFLVQADAMLVAHRKAAETGNRSGELMEAMDAEVSPILDKAKAARFTLDEFELISEFIMVVNDFIITESDDEIEGFNRFDKQIRALDKYPQIKKEYEIVHRMAGATISNVNDHIKYRKQAFEYMKQLDETSGEMEAVGGRLQEEASRNMNDAIAASYEIQSATNAQQGLLTMLGLVLAMLMSIFVTRSITVPIATVTERLKDVAEGEGDLTKRIVIDSMDELGVMVSWFNKFIGDVHDIVARVSRSARIVAEGSRQIAQGNENLSQRSQEQASSLEETAATIEEMTSKIKDNALIARQGNEIAQDVVKSARSGEDVVNRTTNSMKDVTQSSVRISEIITVVNDIAFQTNLLALNAAVEAARAGEQGRGFAVVAGEVRNLATRSADAAREIQALINESTEKVKIGNALVGETRETLKDIIEKINGLAERISEITLISNEQSTAVDQVNLAINQIDSVVQHNASLVEEAAATSENLSAESESLATLMSQFKVEFDETFEGDVELREKPRARQSNFDRIADDSNDRSISYGR